MMAVHFYIDKFCLATILFAMLITEPQEASIMIRIKNNSRYTLKNIKVISPASGLVHFGNLHAGENSDYKTFSSGYAIAAIMAEKEGKKVEFLPDDYLGEQHLKPGKYTYEISLIETPELEYLRLKFLIDKN